MVGILPWRFIPWLSFGSLFCHSQGRKRSFWCKGRFCLARGILKPLCAKEVHQCIFVHCTFKVYDQEVYVFPKKEMRKGPRRASLTVANYIFYGTFHIFALCFFLPLLQVAFSHQSYFRWHWKFSLGPLCTVQRALGELTKPSWLYMLQNVLFFCSTISLDRGFYTTAQLFHNPRCN